MTRQPWLAKVLTRYSAICLTLALTACGTSAPPPAEDDARSSQDAALDRAIQQPLDRARAVEGEMKAAAEARDAEAERQGD